MWITSDFSTNSSMVAEDFLFHASFTNQFPSQFILQDFSELAILLIKSVTQTTHFTLKKHFVTRNDKRRLYY